ncbi:hypothetical protein P170DRAFT_385739 [Aspergillus steynii IBT 23096]|uniref:Zn(2)-C6 fungal-type domain-containing protein n=1 Tax=Aspergillus steynii IBT 23096 TaxID=1392250 RepID=A0A2I2G4I6_9EURO|nr:uncharacterized protein P170DRAFT_385739 [Aspergillus steynii IBT 23096]PLB47792.1 hypothetical protein P170DRAFT_385739 [Aspergillus steynii IBT 23096]
MEASAQAMEKGPLPPKRRSKSRSGCQRCKQRHIKCDERVPFCGPCLKRGFSCPGYRQPMKWRYLDASGQSLRRPEVEADRNLLSEGDADTFTQPATSVGIRNPRESAVNDNLTTFGASANTSEQQRHNRQDITTESWDRDRMIGDGCGSSSDLFPLSFSNDLATENIWNMGNDVMDSLLDNNELNTEFLYPLFKPISDNDVVLSTHYFSNVCPINSCFDSQLNPLRSVMADLKSSQLVFHLVMMTSASHLCHQNNEMSSVAQQHRRYAISVLKEERNVTGKKRFEAVLGSALLGMTSAWQDSRTLGISHIHTARALLQASITGPEKSSDSLSTSFLVGIMAYWEAMVSIIIIQSPSSLDYLTPFCEQESHDVLVYPNPWTGASTTLFIYAAQASTLCRQNRVTKVLNTSMPSAEICEGIFSEQFKKAAELEAKVLQYSPPMLDRIRDPDDRFTPVSHFQHLAQIYRFSILLQLYLTFPDLLRMSSATVSAFDTITSSASGAIQRSPKETMLWLAVNILSLISSVPESSGIKYLLTVPLIISGSALQKIESHEQGIGIPLETSTSRIEKEIHSLHCSDFMILHWRSVVRHKLKVLHDSVGLDPVRRALQLLEAVWLRSDLSFSNRANDSALVFVHWLDVMVEERLESIFG